MLRSLLLGLAILASLIAIGCGLVYFSLLRGYQAHTLMREEVAIMSLSQFFAMAGLVAAIPCWFGFFVLNKNRSKIQV